MGVAFEEVELFVVGTNGAADLESGVTYEVGVYLMGRGVEGGGMLLEVKIGTNGVAKADSSGLGKFLSTGTFDGAAGDE